MVVSDVKRLKELEEENFRLKRMFAELSLDHSVLKDVISKIGWGPTFKGNLWSKSSRGMIYPIVGPLSLPNCHIQSITIITFKVRNMILR